jgi:CRP-like cAMP-binding protein
MEKASKNMFPILRPDDDRLKRFALFSGLGTEELSTLIKLTDCVSMPKGFQIIKNGEGGLCLYLILEGSAGVYAPPPDGEIEIAKFSAGDFFGEISLVDDGPRSADVVALEDCTLLRITRVTIGVLAGLQPTAAVQILSAIGSELVKRLRIANLKYIDLLHQFDGRH